MGDLKIEIRKRLQRYDKLTEFSELHMEVPVCSDSKSDLFTKVQISKAIAQSLLNLYYNKDFYKQCSLYQHIIDTDEYKSNAEFADILNEKKTPTEDIIIDAILQYVRVHKQLYNTEKSSLPKVNQKLASTKTGNMIKCSYCDTESKADIKQCSVCEGLFSEIIDFKESSPKNNAENVSKEMSHENQGLNERKSYSKTSEVDRIYTENIFKKMPSSSLISTIANEEQEELVSRDVLNEEDIGSSPNHGRLITDNDAREISAGGECVETRDDRNSGDRYGASLGNIWTCPSCTFVNREAIESCEICFGAREIRGEVNNVAVGGQKDDRGRRQSLTSLDANQNKESVKMELLSRLNGDASEMMSNSTSIKDKNDKGLNNNRDKQKDQNKQINQDEQIDKDKQKEKGKQSDQSSSSNKYEVLKDVHNEDTTNKSRQTKKVPIGDATVCDETRGPPKTWVWRCKVCTFDNGYMLDQCQACGTNRYDQGGDGVGNKEGGTKISDNSKNKSRSQQVAIPMKSAMVDNKDVNTSPGDSYTGATASTSASLVSRVTTWSCPSCTYNNSSDTTCCVVCFTIPQLEQSNTVTGDNIDDGDDVDVVLEVPTETWKCKKCRCDNLFDTYICDKCHEYAPFFHKWVCEQCRFFNEILSPKCGACGTKNTHLIKCTKCKHNMVNINFDRICDTCSIICDTCNVNCYTMSDVDKEWTEVSYKKCIKCNKKSDSGDPMCKKCTGDIYYCNNRWCGSINSNKVKHCHKCKLKKGSNVTDFNMVEVHCGKSYMQMWQCTFCGLFNTKGKLNKCTICKNMRHSAALRKCSCNWINKANESKCDKCFKILPKRS